MRFEMDNLMDEVKSFLNELPNPYRIPKQIIDFEKSLTEFFDVKDAIAVSTGTAALHCSLAALDIGPGDEVIVPSASLIMSVVPVLYQNATPVFVDCQPNRIDFDYVDLESKMSPRVKAIIPVYLWGCAYDVERLMKFAKRHKVAIVEDACQAHGSKWGSKYLGTWGELGCFSMRDGKLMSTGEGGFILTNNSHLAEKCRNYRNHWTDFLNPDNSFTKLAWNYRISEIQALLGRIQLSYFEHIAKERKSQTKYIYDSLKLIDDIELYNYYENEETNYFSPVFYIKNEKKEKKISIELARLGVLNSVGSFGLRPVQERNVFKRVINELKEKDNLQYNADFNLPHSSAFFEKVISLILLPSYSKDKLDEIISKIKYVLELVKEDDND